MFHETFAKAWLKLVHLGHDKESLTNVEHLLEDHPHASYIENYLWLDMDIADGNCLINLKVNKYN